MYDPVCRLSGCRDPGKKPLRRSEGGKAVRRDRGLTDWILGFETEPKKVFVVHGDDEVCDIFADYLREEHGFDTYAPYSGAVYDLTEDKLVASPEGVRITKKKRAASAVFERLLAAGQRLLAVIRHNEGGANKDLAKFADQINSLCDKWDR